MNDHSAVAKAGSKPTILTLERLTECNTAALSSGCVDRVHVALQLADLGFTCLDVCVVHHAANRQAKPKHAIHVMAGRPVLYGHYRARSELVRKSSASKWLQDVPAYTLDETSMA
ncbi:MULTISPECIES: hypothetical protein [unclassified Mesorhizobium]|uniref:hypothetical protein n=1 Tax=unclassified Mesorhizobium TaxID=325217 RepID=UPI003335C5E0